jgi:hypothetical protein
MRAWVGMTLADSAQAASGFCLVDGCVRAWSVGKACEQGDCPACALKGIELKPSRVFIQSAV